MASIVATADNTYGAINVVVDTNAVATSGVALAVPQAVTLNRVMVDGTKRQVRGTPMFTSGGQAIAWDDEAPLQTPVTYQAILGLGTEVFVDTANRTVASGYGSADTGQSYTVSGGTSNDYAVSSGAMSMVLRTIDVFRTAAVNVGTGNVDVSFEVSLSIGITIGANVSTWVCARYVNLSNFYAVRLDLDNVGRVFALLYKNVGGTLTQLGSTVLVGTGHVAGDKWRMRLQTNGSTISGMVWQPAQGPPSTWQFSVVDSSIAATASTNIAILGWIQLGNTNTLPITATWDNGVAYDMTTTTISSASATITGTGGDIGWLKDPVIPANDIPFSFATTQRECVTATGQVEFVSLSDEVFASANGVFSIINDPRDADIAMLRKSPTMSLVITSQELVDIPRIETIFASGRHLLLQLPTKYGWAYALFGSDYIRCQDVTKGRIGLTNMARPERVWTIPIALARVPVSPTGYLGSNGIGVGKATWGQMAASGLTYAQLNATGKTVLQLSQGQGY